MGFGLTIDGKHTSEFGLRMTSMYIPMPEAKTYFVDIPYASSSIDLSDVTGNVNYKDRKGIEFSFVLYDGDYDRWAMAYSAIAMWIHGKSVQVIPDNDFNFYYVCRLEVDSKKSSRINSRIVLSGTAEPFKYDRLASDDDWLWDPFNFEIGIIRELSDISITDANRHIEITGGGCPAVPEFIVRESSNLKVTYNGQTFDMLLPGTYRFPQIKVGEDSVVLVFLGAGKLSIRYRGIFL